MAPLFTSYANFGALKPLPASLSSSEMWRWSIRTCADEASRVGEKLRMEKEMPGREPEVS